MRLVPARIERGAEVPRHVLVEHERFEASFLGSRGEGVEASDGAADQAKGKAQEAWGDATDDPETEARGKANQAEGEAERAG